MTGDPLPGLAAARLWAATRFPYLASGLFGVQAVPAPGSGTASVDRQWRLRADPSVAAGWTPAELGSVLVHHVCHLLRDHAERAVASVRTTADSPLWVRAADAEINDDLIPAGLELPGDPALPKHFGAPPGKMAEEYYAMLRKAATGARASSGEEPPARSGWLDCGSGADGQPRDGERESGRAGLAGLTRGRRTCCGGRWRRTWRGTARSRERFRRGCCAGRGRCWRPR